MPKKRRSKASLTPRSDHVGRSLTIPHQELYRATRGFLKDMTASEDLYRQEIKDIRDKLEIDAPYVETPDVERQSLAVQVFAAMTVEASISFYAVLRFGGEHFEENFRWGSLPERLKDVFKRARTTLHDDSEIVKVVERIARARNAIVHPVAAEYSGPEDSSTRQPDWIPPDASAGAAHRVVAELDRFLGLLGESDPEHRHFFVMY